ncbi:MAG: nucleotidyltransferase domain-containing protein [bacterium]|nr:nucleotidyltransferase domain-containing protein [bacterium]
MLLGVSGSRGYGTDTPDSDIDLRGVTQNLPSDLLGLTSFEQYEDAQTDTVIYSFNKLVTLLLGCNPNTIEILGLDEDQYLIISPLGRELLDNKSLFLSKRAASSFGNYAGDQLRRLQNAIARDTLPQPDQEKHILRSVHNALEDFNRQHNHDGREMIKLYIDAAETPELETEIFLDDEFRHYPLRRYSDLLKTLGNVIRIYKVIGHRNHKKTT